MAAAQRGPPYQCTGLRYIEHHARGSFPNTVRNPTAEDMDTSRLKVGNDDDSTTESLNEVIVGDNHPNRPNRH